MKINRDFFDNPIVPDYILCKANKERIGVLQCAEKNIDFKFNELNEINFTTYLYIDGEKNQFYDDINVMKYILLPTIGFFSITSVNINSEGTDFESKSVTAKSYECLLAQKYLEEFVINMGTVESIDGIQFYNIREKDKSLIHLVLEKCPDWEIGHIDASLMTMQRSFEISRQNIYTFLCTDVAEAFECFFLFDTLNNTINIYREDNIGKNTNIHVSYINLLKNTNLSCSTDNIKTCLTLTGADDLTVREINMGYDKIYNFNFYNSTEFMSQKLYDAYNKWVVLWNSQLSTYTSLLSQYQDYYKQINYLTHKKMPSVTGSTNWAEYGLQPLKEQLAAYEQKQAVSMKSGHGDSSSPFYNSEYLPIYNSIQAITAQIKVLENQIKALRDQQLSISNQMSAIITSVDMKNNFTKEELKELSSFIREDELDNSNYVVTDTMTDDEIFEMLNNMLEFGEHELAKAAVPQLSFDADVANLFAIPEFEPFYDDFETGNCIWVSLRDNFSVKAKLLSIHINFFDPTDFSVTFGNIVRKAKTRYTDFTDTIRTAANVATSVSFNSSYWSQAAKDTSNINKMLADGLLSAGNYLSSGGDNSDFLLDRRGLFVNTTSGKYAGKDSIFIGGGRILFTDDNWKTVRMSVGRADVTINGKTESYFGTFADFVIAGYIGGSIVEGTEIIGGTIKSTNYVAGKTGSQIDLTNGTFEFNANNESKLTLDTSGVLTVKGTIKAELGYIGGQNGFTIMSGKLYSLKDSLTSNKDGIYIGIDGIALGANNKFKALSDGTFYAEKGYLGGTNGFTLETKKIYNGKPTLHDLANGIYLGTDGIALGADNVFSVTPQGYLTTKYGSIGGAIISNNSIHASNNNWWISSDGSATFKNVFVTGVQPGSNFGSLNFNNGITSGNFSGASYYGSNIANPFNGTTVTHIQSISADHIRVKYLEGMDAKIEDLETTRIKTTEVYAKFMAVEKWVSAEYIRADKINVKELTSIMVNSTYFTGAVLKCKAINIDGGMSQTGPTIGIGGTTYSQKTANIRFADGTTGSITYLGA